MGKIKGIDISQWQGNIDFQKVKSDGVQFTIIREGYGSSNVDPKFFEYVRNCKSNGIEVKGVYHFSYALNAKMAEQEAIFCIQQMQKAGLGKDCIVFFDLEYDSVNYAKKQGVNIGKNECVTFTRAFCEKVTQLGYTAGIYSNISYYQTMYDPNLIAKYVYWLAHYTSGSPAYPCKFQQFASDGKVNGINGNVDVDWYFGDNANTSPTPKKSLDEIAKEVIQGKWGNGDDRKNRLKSAGYDYNAVQAKVNSLSLSTPKKSLDEIAREVLAGKWGNGDNRKKSLENAGYNYSKIQQKVNELCGRKSITEIAKEVIQGKWGNNPTRKSKLESAGYDYNAVQAEVNRLMH